MRVAPNTVLFRASGVSAVASSVFVPGVVRAFPEGRLRGINTPQVRLWYLVTGDAPFDLMAWGGLA
jgi:hypothetical protein